MATTMNAQNAVSSKMAECYITLDGKRFNMMNAINVEAKAEIKKSDIPILGKTVTGKKPNGWEGTGSATFHYNTPMFRHMLNKYKKTGQIIYFDMQIVNDDPSAGIGEQIVTLKNCTLDSAVLAKFDAASDDVLEEEADFTFDDFEYAKGFTPMPGYSMGAVKK